jgi:tetratricopeptide (TPR) repeat protein
MTIKKKLDMERVKVQVLCCVLIAFVGGIVFGNHLKNSFQFDSVAYIVNNQNLDTPEEMLTVGFWTRDVFSRSLLRVSMAFNALLGQKQPFGYHLFNLTFHVFNALLIFFITRKLCLDFSRASNTGWTDNIQMISLFTAILFLCHPLQTESVVYIMSRSEVLAATFYLGGFYLFQSTIENGRMVSSSMKLAWILPLLVLLFILGFSVKQTLITLPAVLLLYSLCLLDAQSRPIRFLKRWRWVLTGVIFLAGIILLKKLLDDETFLIGPSNPDEMVGRKNYMLSQPAVLIFYYLKLLLFPFNLNIDPDIPVVTELFSLRFLLPVACMGALIYLSARVEKTRVYFFLVAWFFILISPSSSIVTLHDLAAEHRAYLAAYGFYLLLVLGLFHLNVKRSALFVVLVFLTCSLGMTTITRNRVWQSELTLWADTQKKSPRIVRPLINLGRAYGEAGETEKAIYYYEKSLGLAPAVFAPNYNLGDLYLAKGQVDRALKLFHRALQLDPGIPEVQGKLGEIYLGKKQYVLAEEYFKKAIELNPKYPSVLRNLGILNYFHLGRHRQGIAYFSRSLTLDPDQPGADKIREIVARFRISPNDNEKKARPGPGG